MLDFVPPCIFMAALKVSPHLLCSVLGDIVFLVAEVGVRACVAVYKVKKKYCTFLATI